jgi:two-component system response regulator YcbB
MRFYLIDDDMSVLNILKIIIEERQLGEICGIASNGAEALEDLAVLKPDIVIVDLLMPVMDGISFVREARKLPTPPVFIMLSQVSSKDMVASAYESGIEFFLQKPINSIEVEKVIGKVSQSLTMQRTFAKMHDLFQMEIQPENLQKREGVEQEPKHRQKLTDILQKLGIAGERGSKDIVSLVDYLIAHGEIVQDSSLNELCSQFGDNPKSLEQRIRRAATAGLVNLANLGIEDYANDTFLEYANTLYNFEQVKKEMDCIRGKSTVHGKVFMKKFLNALVSYCQKDS